MTARRSLDCLSCGATLDQREEHGVTVDYCPECGGVWLDPGELEQLTGHGHSHSHSHGHHGHADIDIEDEEEYEEEEEEGGILGTIAGALGGEEGEEGEFEEEEEFEMEGGFEEEDEF
jgi:Zn-finger nucleic acid-binding protein